MYGLRHFVHNQVKSVVEAVTPTPTQSQFEEKRLITPDEFVIAGDHLVESVGSWNWSGGDPSKRVPYLPAEKQFLVTRNVPCKRRAGAMEMAGQAETTVAADGGTASEATSPDNWVCPSGGPTTVAGPSGGGAALVATAEGAALGLDAARDDEDDTFRPPQPPNGEERRTYDLYMTYSKYYQVPQFWLVGFSASKTLLTVPEMQQDISADHMAKTVTVDPFPHTKALIAMSIHPCKHANTMKVFADQQVENGRPFPVDHYLLLFLKFISGVVPTIEYDYTMGYEMS